MRLKQDIYSVFHLGMVVCCWPELIILTVKYVHTCITFLMHDKLYNVVINNEQTLNTTLAFVASLDAAVSFSVCISFI